MNTHVHKSFIILISFETAAINGFAAAVTSAACACGVKRAAAEAHQGRRSTCGRGTGCPPPRRLQIYPQPAPPHEAWAQTSAPPPLLPAGAVMPSAGGCVMAAGGSLPTVAAPCSAAMATPAAWIWLGGTVGGTGRDREEEQGRKKGGGFWKFRVA